MYKDKKAELTSHHLIVLVILVISFVIILFFYFAFNWTGTITKETCRQSVTYKATVPNILIEKKPANLPLKCQTEKICLRQDSADSCSSFKGEKDVSNIKLSSSNVEEDAKRKIADELYSCWDIMGQGKLYVFQGEIDQFGYTHRCVICSRIALGDDFKEKVGELNIADYIQKTNVPGRDYTYLNFLTGDTKKEAGLFVPDEFVNVADNVDSKGIVISPSNEYSIVFIEHDRGAGVASSVSLLSILVGPKLMKVGLGKGVGKGQKILGGVFKKDSSLGTGFDSLGKAAGISFLPFVKAASPSITGDVIGWLIVGAVTYFASELGNAASGAIIGDKYVSEWLVVPYSAEDLKKLECDTFEGYS